MSIFARTPESNAAWHQLKRNVALRPDAQRRSAHEDEERSRELQLLFAGTRQMRRLPLLIRANVHSHFAARPLAHLTD